MTDIHNLEARRSFLKPQDNPDLSREYLVTFEKTIPSKQGDIKLFVAAIPDKYILPNAVMKQYFAQYESAELPEAADIVHYILNDIANEMIPFWVRVIGRIDADHFSEEIIAEDIQPKWDNPALIQMVKTTLA